MNLSVFLILSTFAIIILEKSTDISCIGDNAVLYVKVEIMLDTTTDNLLNIIMLFHKSKMIEFDMPVRMVVIVSQRILIYNDKIL